MRHILRILAITLLVIAFSGCAKKGLEPGEGYVNVDGGKVWYHIYGHGTKTPLLILHGGPGIPSAYLNPLKVLADDRPVIFYDQLGCGKSPAETDSTDWTIGHFVKRLGEIRAALGLDKVYIYGHSWGSMLATEYMFTKPKGVKGLIFAGPALSIPRWIEDVNKLKATLPDSVQAVIEKNEADGTFDAPEYQAAIQVFYQKYLVHNQPWSADMDTALSTMNPALYTYMCGPSEFSITGTLKNFDVTDSLGQIDVPTLFSVGEFDEASVDAAKYFASLMPNAEVVVVPNAGHISCQDNLDADANNIRTFLDKLDKE